ncbi:MAG: hypothetical protein Fur0022_21280 [Anaerolineales bacterium]
MFAQLLQTLAPNHRLLRTWNLTGGVSAQVTALEILTPTGETHRWVARQHGTRDHTRNPHLAADEYQLLQLLYAAGVPVPAPLHLIPSGIFPDPLLIVEYIEGHTDFAPADLEPYLTQLAAHLAHLHQLDPAPFTFLPKHTPIPPPSDHLDDSLSESQIRAALLTLSPPLPYPSTLLHGDYWPGNLLWRAGQLVAILDWEDAALGHPLADVANTRLELLWAFGQTAQETFTHLYQTFNPLPPTTLPYWDLCAALRPAGKLSSWGLAKTTENIMREHHKAFVEQALRQLNLS